MMTALILIRLAWLGWPFSISKSSHAASKSVDNSSVDMLLGIDYWRCIRCPIGVC